MDIKDFSEKFFKALSPILVQSENKHIADKHDRFVTTCQRAFLDTAKTLQITEITDKNYESLTDAYNKRLQELVDNGKLNKSPWLYKEVADLAHLVLESLLSELLTKELSQNKRMQTKPSQTSLKQGSQSSNNGSQFVPHFNQVSSPSKPVKQIVIPNGAVALKDNNKGFSKENVLAANNETPFKEGDYAFEDNGFKPEDLKELEFAVNCSSFPKLALYLGLEKHQNNRIDPHTASIAINLAYKREKNPQFLTPNQVSKIIAELHQAKKNCKA
jgi:hypothetical protein